MNTNKLTTTAASISFAAVSVLTAQEEILELEVMEGSGVAIEESVLPTTRPFNSVYGTDRSILETPRNVTIISREQLDAINIKDVRDFTKLTSSSYTKTNFGAPSTPNLRGDESDLYVNGMRRGLSTNGNGLPINFNSVESVNIVKGPAGAVYGTTNYIGGYADLITKRPYFDGPTGRRGHAFGRSLTGGPLRLRFPDPRLPQGWPDIAESRAFDAGVALRSHGALVWLHVHRCLRRLYYLRELQSKNQVVAI